LLAYPRLADELTQRSRPKAGVDFALTDRQRRRDVPFGLVDIIVLESAQLNIRHFFPSSDSAARSALVPQSTAINWG
jgi:hypothetical protein